MYAQAEKILKIRKEANNNVPAPKTSKSIRKKAAEL